MSILLFMYFSIESNEPKFLSMDTDESEFSAFPQDPAGVAKKLGIKKKNMPLVPSVDMKSKSLQKFEMLRIPTHLHPSTKFLAHLTQSRNTNQQ